MAPTTACPPPYLDPRTTRFGESDKELQTELMRFVVCGNLRGIPAISFPAGCTDQGLPIGIQSIGRHWQESLPLRLAGVAEQELERQKPNMHFDTLSDQA